jgi:hypothetical protein
VRINNEPEEEERKKKKKMPFIVATYVYASNQGQSTHSARTNNILNKKLHYDEKHIEPVFLF